MNLAEHLLLTAVLAISTYGAFKWRRTAPWLPSRSVDMERIKKLIDLKPGEKFIELGAGDAKILSALAKDSRENKLVGLEIFLLPYLIGLIRLALTGSLKKVNFRFANFEKQKLDGFDVVYVFLTPHGLENIKPQLESQMKPGSRLVSYAFRMPGWQEESMDKPNKWSLPIYRYYR